MTFVDVLRLFEHWGRFPPPRVFLAMLVGWKPPEAESEKKYMTADDMRCLMATTGGKIDGLGRG